MSVLGKWRIIELPGYEDDYADMVEPAYIIFEAACQSARKVDTLSACNIARWLGRPEAMRGALA